MKVFPCTECNEETTDRDSDNAGTCVTCQEYLYYHGGNEPVRHLFKATIETRDGEHEYNAEEFVIAETLDEAEEYFNEYLSDYFGEETKPTDKGVENDWGTLAAKIDFVGVANGFTVRTIEGEIVHVNYKIYSDVKS